jgi:hypothetical protein
VDSLSESRYLFKSSRPLLRVADSAFHLNADPDPTLFFNADCIPYDVFFLGRNSKLKNYFDYCKHNTYCSPWEERGSSWVSQFFGRSSAPTHKSPVQEEATV